MKILPPEDGFLGLEPDQAVDYNTAKAVIIPFGLEASVSYGGGTSKGPQAMIDASHQVELFDEHFWCEPYKKIGIVTLPEPVIEKPIVKAVDQLEKIVQQRTDESGIGFAASVKGKNKVSANNVIKKVENQDLIKFGLIPEFVGRLPVISVLDELDESALLAILTQPKNALTKQYKKLFEFEGVSIEFREDALHEVASMAIKRKSGARGLRSIVEHALLDIMYEIPSLDGLKQVIIDKNVVQGKSKPLYIYEGDEKKTAN